ncbi:TetR/AcrR family transcriptional regulator [Acidisphaera sp. L21]|uniref:TetR/AcrR family transcriptional regulator n=1 Tax=Acidisphaera sp. L21 TaxID=1641851 RepID=UPI00131C26EC|nr:TetR/AcrR family transcriptional regulator [Acidisphaera sp. L21]
MSTMLADARAPQRPKGHQRVAVILAAAATVFQERGFEAATMTEIAARSGTAFGSLYRFFPSKAALADALLQQYAQQALDGLAALAEQAAGLTSDGLADALVDFALSLQAMRSFAVAVMGSHYGTLDRRAQFRQAVHDGMVLILCRAWPELPGLQASSVASALLHVLKGAAAAAQDGAEPQGPLLTEYRTLTRRYLAGV